MKKDLIKLGIAGIILASLILTIILLPKSKTDKDSKKQLTEKKLFSIKKDDVVKVILNNSKKPIILVKNDKGVWNIDQPRKLDIDHDSFTMLLTQIINLKSNNDYSDDNLKKYGLDDPKISYEMVLKDGKKIIIFKGNQAPDGVSYYCKLNDDKRIYNIHQAFFSKTGVDKGVKELRDKDFLKLKEDDLTKIENKQFVLKKENKQWIVETMDKKETDFQKTLGYVNDLLNLKADDFIEDSEQIKKISFEGERKLDLTLNTTNQTINIILNKIKNKVYAKKVGEDRVFQVAEYTYNNLNKKTTDFKIDNTKKDKKISKDDHHLHNH